MRAREFIVEYKRDITAKKVGEKLLARNKAADMTKLNTAEEILEQLESADPSKNKQYTQWIANRYLAGDFFLEDLEVVKRYIEKFIEARDKRLLDVVDIGRYSLGTLKEKINQVFKSDDENAGMGGALYPVIPGTEVLYNGPQGQFAIMSTLEGSMQHNKQVGEFAEWCTADSRAPRHYSEHANQGPLYVYVDPQGKKYQLHFETNQFKNKLDREIGLEKEKEIVSLPFVWKNIDWNRAIQNGATKVLQLMPEELKTPELCLAAIKQNGWALAYVPEEFKTPEFYLAAVKQNGFALGYVPEELKTPELCVAAIKQDGMALEYVPTKLKTPELCLAAVKQNGIALASVPEKLLTPELCLAAVKQDGRALEYVPTKLRTPEICLAAVKQNCDALEYVPTKLKTPEFYLAVIKQNGWALRFVSEELKTPELCLAAVQQNGRALRYVPEELKTPELCLTAIKQDGMALEYVPEAIRDQVKQAAGL